MSNFLLISLVPRYSTNVEKAWHYGSSLRSVRANLRVFRSVLGFSEQFGSSIYLLLLSLNVDLGFAILLPSSSDRNDPGVMVSFGGNGISRIGHDSKGLSNVVVVMLSLIIVVTIVVNVVLWSYQMNQFDLERMHEDVKITDVADVNGSSSWFPTQEEFTVDAGNKVSGTYVDTQSIDGSYESFSGNNPGALEIDGTFPVDLSAYPLNRIQTLEIQMAYRSSGAGENWYLEAYNWTSSAFSDVGFNSTSGSLPTTGWDNYAVNLTDQWNSYMSSNGTVWIKVFEQGTDANQTTIDIDFIAVRAATNMTSFTFENDGSFTSHLVALWIDNSTSHQRYDISIYINSGDTVSYSRVDTNLPEKPYTVKVITERGNIAIYSTS